MNRYSYLFGGLEHDFYFPLPSWDDPIWRTPSIFQASKARYEAVLSISAEQLVRASRRMFETSGRTTRKTWLFGRKKPEKSGIVHDFSRKNQEKLWHFPRRWRFIMIYQM